MGCFSVYCGISKINIMPGDECCILLLQVNKNYGKKQIANEQPFIPIALPIFGKYDDYGNICEVVRDKNVEAIEKHFGCTIEYFLAQLRENGMKKDYDDSYSNFLNSLKIENKEEFLQLSYMFIDKKVYDFMTLRGTEHVEKRVESIRNSEHKFWELFNWNRKEFEALEVEMFAKKNGDGWQKIIPIKNIFTRYMLDFDTFIVGFTELLYLSNQMRDISGYFDKYRPFISREQHGDDTHYDKTMNKFVSISKQKQKERLDKENGGI